MPVVAAVLRGGSLLELDPDDFERAWRVGVFGALYCAREAASDMLASGRNSGTILFTGFTSSVRGGGIALPVPLNLGSRGLAQSLARELWPRGRFHVAHIVLDGGFADLSVGPAANDELDPDAMATVYWQLVCQVAQRVDLRTRSSPIPRKILRVASGRAVWPVRTCQARSSLSTRATASRRGCAANQDKLPSNFLFHLLSDVWQVFVH